MVHLRPEHAQRLDELLKTVPRNSLGELIYKAFRDPYEPIDAFFDRLHNTPDEDVVTLLEWALARILRDQKR